MMKGKKYFILTISILLLSSLSGCASFRAGNLPPVSQWPPESTSKGKTISLVISGETIVNEKEQEVNSKFLETWREQIVKAYNDSGLFSEVKTGLAEADVRAEVKIIDRGEFNLGMSVLTGLTLYLIPSKATDEFIIKTTIKDRAANTLDTFEKSEIINFWQQLFLIFATPFNFPPSVAKETIYDLNRVTINEAHSRGFL